jgi:alpha-tubulin suppressor-like RCC1 family protein
VSGGTVACWGANTYGQLGDGTLLDRDAPVRVVGLSGVTAIACGAYHTCAIVSGGAVECWGSSADGKLGNGSVYDSPTPVAVSNLSGVTAIAAGFSHTCTAGYDGVARCWGSNASGQLGDGTTTTRSTPVAVAGLQTNARQVAAGGAHSCALLTSGGIECWGSNAYGQLGNGTTTDSVTPVVAVTAQYGANSVSAGGYHTCGVVWVSVPPVSLQSTVQCWGYNGYGELGNGTTTNSSTPVKVMNADYCTVVVAGVFHSCALFTNSPVQCWGDGSAGQLGNGATSNSSTPVATTAVTTVSGPYCTGTGLAASNANGTCALSVGAQVECWGNNSNGQLGNATTTSSSSPVSVFWQ